MMAVCHNNRDIFILPPAPLYLRGGTNFRNMINEDNYEK